MKVLNRLVLLLILMSLASISNAYDPTWENFDTSQLSDMTDQTIGEGQRLLQQRGGDLECVQCHVEVDDEYEGVIDLLEITQYTMEAALSCANWEVRGICVWVTCVAFVCVPSTSIKVQNHVPELVMQSYDRANGEPWKESQLINAVSFADADSSFVMQLIDLVTDTNLDSVGIGGGISTQGSKKKKAGLAFKLVDAYGNPAIAAFQALAAGTFNLVCQGQAVPLFPYFVSNLDAIGWRWNIPEMFYPQSLIPVFNTWSLGTFGNNYGPIYPRHGFLFQNDDLKAAVVTTFRAAHFITRTGTPHVNITLNPNGYDGYWPEPPLDQNDGDTGEFQMLYPKKDSSCQRFPYGMTPSSNRRSTDGSYVWSFWKAYKCCARVGASLVYHTG